MKTVAKVQTFDGLAHDSERDARRHLEKKLADLMTPLCHRLAQSQKYAEVSQIMQDSLETFRAALKIHDDMSLEETD